MQYILTFDSVETRNDFATKAGLPLAEDITLFIPLALLSVAKNNLAVVSIAVDSPAAEQFVVKINALENDNYIVETSDPLSLYDLVAGKMDPVNTELKLLSQLTGTVVSLDDPSTQWARIRTASRYRPFPDSFEKIRSDYKQKPEIYVLDSGIDFTHPEFASPTLETEDFFALDAFAGDFSDATGHGTAIASAIAGANVGLHQYAKIINCKIFGETQKATLLELQQLIGNILARHQTSLEVPKVVNISWVAPKSFYLEEAIQNLIDSGITVVAAAGNFGDDVANYTPAGMANVITVGASDINDYAAGFSGTAGADATITSNWGQMLDIFAPGVDVTVANHSGGYLKISGTSPAAGFATGAVAAILAVWPADAGAPVPANVINVLAEDSTKGVMLLDPAKYSNNQNKIVHLVDGFGELYAYAGQDFYLGAFTGTTNSITGDINVLTFGFTQDAFNNSATYELKWTDPAIQAKYEKYINLNTNSGYFAISKPAEQLPEGQTLELVRFYISQTSTVGTADSPTMFFFATDPNKDSSYDYVTDIAASLETLNNYVGTCPAALK